MADEKNPHAGHRQRMLKKYLEHGISTFDEYEILEIFLYTAYSRRNTSDISRQLIDKYGSLSGVLNAGYNELVTEPDVGSTTAALISFVKDLARRYAKEDLSGIKLSTSDSMRDYCYKLLKETITEQSRAIFLDQTMNLIGDIPVSRNSDGFDQRAIVTHAIKTQCCNIVLAHSHPGGVLLPSASDVAATRRVSLSLKNIGISLMDNIIVNTEGTYSMRAAGVAPDLW